MVKLGFLDSSVKYKIRRDGRARKIRIIAGKIVHTVSICCASIKYRLVYLFIIIVYRA